MVLFQVEERVAFVRDGEDGEGLELIMRLFFDNLYPTLLR
jgi:hypothetical protein